MVLVLLHHVRTLAWDCLSDSCDTHGKLSSCSMIFFPNESYNLCGFWHEDEVVPWLSSLLVAVAPPGVVTESVVYAGNGVVRPPASPALRLTCGPLLARAPRPAPRTRPPWQWFLGLLAAHTRTLAAAAPCFPAHGRC